MREQVNVSSVIGEILVGIIIGNTILFQWLNLNLDLSFLQILSKLGVIFLFLDVGLETPFSELRARC